MAERASTVRAVMEDSRRKRDETGQDVAFVEGQPEYRECQDWRRGTLRFWVSPHLTDYQPAIGDNQQ